MKQLNNLKRKIDPLLKDFLAPKKDQFPKGTIYDEMVEQIIDLIFRPGAERLRPILVYFGYKLFSNIQSPISNLQYPINDVLQLSLCTELFHTAALIHDDIMDKAKTRRGGPTVHEYFARKLQIRHSGDPAEGGGLQNRFWTSQNDDEAHELGINLAILAGDLCLIWADEIFSLSKIDRRLLLKVKKQFDLLREEVIFGQSLDLIKVEPCTRFHLLKIYEYKTARYSFVRPLLLGAVLAEADKKQKEAISNYAIPVGIAFQIQDDLLDSETELLGTKKECKDLAKDLINKGKRAIIEYSSQTRYNGVLAIEAKEFLLELADYSVTRQS